MRGDKKYSNYEQIIEYDALMICRNNYTLSEDMIILFDNKKYSINSIINDKSQHILKIELQKINE